MPNWCQNVAYINHEDKKLVEDFKAKIDEDKEKIFEHFLPNPTGEWDYAWSCENWGCKWDASPYEYYINEDGALYLSFDTAWGPPVVFYEYLYQEGYDVEAFYNEEGMAFCGWFIDGEDNQYAYSDMSADEMEESLPARLDEMFCISQYQRDREEEEYFGEDEEDEPQLPEYEMTDWFNVKDKPVRNGWYEVRTASWPFPQKVEWTGKKWITDNEVTDWRGIAYDPVQKEADLLKALDELKEEFEKLVLEESETK